MRRRITTYCFFFFLAFMVKHPLLAQENKVYSFQIRVSTFENIVDSIQSKTGYRIFYDPLSVDTLAHSFVVEAKPIEVIIQTLIQNKPLQFYITNQKQIFIFDRATEAVCFGLMSV